MVLTTPLLAQLAGQGAVDVVAIPSSAGLLANHPAVREVIEEPVAPAGRLTRLLGGRRPVAPPPREARPRAGSVVPSAGPADEPDPWTYRGMAALMSVVALLQVPLAVVDWSQDHRTHPFIAYLVIALYPAAIPLTLFASFLLAMPVARRIAGEPRPMRILETLSVSAIVMILLLAFWSPVFSAHGGALDSGDSAQLAAGAAADAVALVVGGAVYPFVYRRFWMPRRRMRR